MKTFVAIPCMDSTYTLFDQCLDNLDIKGLGDVSINRCPGTLVYVARNQLAEAAIKERADYILWIDSDMVFPADLLERLMDDMRDADIVCPIMFRRKPPYTPAIYKTIKLGLPGDEIVEGYDEYPRDEIFECDAVGFGCVLMRTDIALHVLTNFKTMFTPIPGYGEDISFCIRAKKLGYKIACDSRIKIGHLTQSVVTEEFYDTYRKSHKDKE